MHLRETVYYDYDGLLCRDLLPDANFCEGEILVAHTVVYLRHVCSTPHVGLSWHWFL